LPAAFVFRLGNLSHCDNVTRPAVMLPNQLLGSVANPAIHESTSQLDKIPLIAARRRTLAGYFGEAVCNVRL